MTMQFGQQSYGSNPPSYRETTPADYSGTSQKQSGGGFGDMAANMGWSMLGSEVAAGARQKEFKGMKVGETTSPWEFLANYALPRNQFQTRPPGYYLGENI